MSKKLRKSFLKKLRKSFLKKLQQSFLKLNLPEHSWIARHLVSRRRCRRQCGRHCHLLAIQLIGVRCLWNSIIWVMLLMIQKYRGTCISYVWRETHALQRNLVDGSDLLRLKFISLNGWWAVSSCGCSSIVWIELMKSCRLYVSIWVSVSLFKSLISIFRRIKF